MKKIISITEVVDRFGSGSEEVEFRATADAQYDEAKNKLIVDLKSFIHPEKCVSSEALSRPGWQPQRQTVNSIVSWEETIPAAKDIFHSWIRKLTQSMSSQSNIQRKESYDSQIQH